MHRLFRYTVIASLAPRGANGSSIRYGSRLSSTAVSSSAVNTSPSPFSCLLCDCEVPSWKEHRELPSHVARAAVCNAFVMPERSEAILQQLHRHIRLDLRAVDDVAAQKQRRRHVRLRSTFVHLAEEGVLSDGIPSWSTASSAGSNAAEADGSSPSSSSCLGSYVVSDAFLNLMLVGEGFARQEVVDRVARLIPTLGVTELSSVVTFLLSPRHLARLYDELDFHQLITARAQRAARTSSTVPGTSLAVKERDESDESTVDSPLPQPPVLPVEEKAVFVFSCIGELVLFHRQDRSHSVANKAAVDGLVQNVLATHAVESLLSELIHTELQRVVEEGTPVWEKYRSQSVQMSTTVTTSTTTLQRRRIEPAIRPLPCPLIKSPPAQSPSSFSPSSNRAAAEELKAFLPAVEPEALEQGDEATRVEQRAAVGQTSTTHHVDWEGLKQRVISDAGNSTSVHGGTNSFALPFPRLSTRPRFSSDNV